jgi:hypothetical protein
VLGRLEHFSDHISPLFKWKQATEKLQPFQKWLLLSLKQPPLLLFPESDKGLGPVP